MIYREFPGLGRDLSALCLGSMNFGVTLDEKDSFQMLDAFVEMGGNFIDTARVYGGFSPAGLGAAEKVIGKWIKERGCRDKIVLATKGAHPPVGDFATNRLDKENIRADITKSLEALGVDQIDIYWLHRDDESRPVEDILSTLNECIQQGMIRSIGASNWSTARLMQVREKAYMGSMTGFSCNQPLWSLARDEAEEDLKSKTLVQMDKTMFQWHEANNMACMPYTSQAKGFFSKMAAGGVAALSEKARERYLSEGNLRIFEEVKAICGETGLSAGAVALAFLTGQKEFHVHPIVGVSNMDQLEALRDAGDAVLSDEQIQRLMNLTQLV